MTRPSRASARLKSGNTHTTSGGEHYDVLVVGGGGAGLATAVSAAQAGASVVLVERNAQLGGTTAKAVGSISAARSRVQRRAGIADSSESFASDMGKFIGSLEDRDVPELRDMLAREAGETVDWLESLGVSFVGPFQEPPHSASRLVNAFPTSSSYIFWLARAATKLGVTTLTRSRLTAARRSKDGSWNARFESIDGEFDITAKTLVFATGDFSGNAELRRRWLPEAAWGALPINSSATGDAHELGIALGADTRNLDLVFGPQLRFPEASGPQIVAKLPNWRWFQRLGAACFNLAPSWIVRPLVRPMMVTHMSPSSALFTEGAILVNSAGLRFCDERTSVTALSSQPGKVGYIILNQDTAAKFGRAGNFLSTIPGLTYAYLDDYRRGRRDLYHAADGPQELARKIGLDGDNLSASVGEAWGQAPARLIALGPVHSMLTVTEGGLTIDENCRVLNHGSEAIDGLYAVGGAGGGLPLNGHGHHIAWAMTSGRIAGTDAARHAAERGVRRFAEEPG